VTLLARNIDIVTGEDVSPVVQAEDVQHNVFPLPIEYFAPVPKAEWLTEIVVRLPDNMPSGDFEIMVSFRNRASKRGLLTVTSGAIP
jgi:hypothetical protein